MAQVVEILRKALGKRSLSVRENSKFKNTVLNHTSVFLKWDYRRVKQAWDVEIRSKFKSFVPYKTNRAKKVCAMILTQLFKAHIFVPVHKISNHKYCHQPLVEPGENICHILNQLDDYHLSPIDDSGQQYVTVILALENFICGAKGFFFCFQLFNTLKDSEEPDSVRSARVKFLTIKAVILCF